MTAESWDEYPSSLPLGYDGSGGVHVLCCLRALSSRIESQKSMVVPGYFPYSVPPPHSPAGVFWGPFANKYTRILVLGSPFGEHRPRYHSLGITIHWLTKVYTKI